MRVRAIAVIALALLVAAPIGAQKMAEPEDRAVAIIRWRGVSDIPETPPVTDPRTWDEYIYGPGLSVFLDDQGDEHIRPFFSITNDYATAGSMVVRDSDNELSPGPIDTGSLPLPVRWPQSGTSPIRGQVPVLDDDYVDQTTPHQLTMRTAPTELYVGTLDLNSTAKQNLITVPTDRVLIVTEVILDEASAAVATATGSSFGFDASATDVVSDAKVETLTGTDLYTIVRPVNGAKTGAAAAVFGFKLTTAEGATRSCKVRVFGFFK